MEEIKVSVLVYVRNDVLHIEECLCSVMNQTLKEMEIIVIDGGSTDGTLDIIYKLSRQDLRIKVINSEPGVGKQFNTGLRAAEGKYIGICESDDYLLPEMYEQQYMIAEQNRLDMLRADVNRFCETQHGKVFFPFHITNDMTMYNGVICSYKDVRFLKLGVNGFWSGLYRREFLLEQKIFMNETQGAAYQDISIAFLAAVKAGRAMIINRAFYCYRMDNPNSSVNNPNKLTMLLEEYELLRHRLEQEGLFEQYKEIYLSWKLSGHLWFFDNVSTELKKQYCQLMYQDISNEMAVTEYQETELNFPEKQLLFHVKESPDSFFIYMEHQSRLTENMLQSFENLDKNCKIIVFGNGNLGELVLYYIYETGRRIEALIDNNSMLWGKKIRDVSVMSPQQAVENYSQSIYIIANAVHFEEMNRQLVKMGIPQQNILICSHYDVFLKRVLVKALKEKE